MVNFNIGYYDDYGNLVDSLRAARRNYLRRWDGFALDVMSLVPFELISHIRGRGELFGHYMMLTHMLRIIHVKRYLKSLQSRITVKYACAGADPRFAVTEYYTVSGKKEARVF